MRSRDKAKAQRAKAGFLRRDGRPAPVSNKQEGAQGPKAEVPGQTEASSSSTRRWKWTCPFGDVVGFASNAGLAHTQACRHRLKLHRAQILREREDRARYKVRKVGDHFEWECNVCSRILKAPSKQQLQCMHWRHIRVDHADRPTRDFTTLEGRRCRTNQVSVQGCKRKLKQFLDGRRQAVVCEGVEPHPGPEAHTTSSSTPTRTLRWTQRRRSAEPLGSPSGSQDAAAARGYFPGVQGLSG